MYTKSSQSSTIDTDKGLIATVDKYLEKHKNKIRQIRIKTSSFKKNVQNLVKTYYFFLSRINLLFIKGLTPVPEVANLTGIPGKFSWQKRLFFDRLQFAMISAKQIKIKSCQAEITANSQALFFFHPPFHPLSVAPLWIFPESPPGVSTGLHIWAFCTFTKMTQNRAENQYVTNVFC